MKIKLDPGAIMPNSAHGTDAGLDLYAPEDANIWPHYRKIINTGVHVEIPEGCVGLLTSKSGLMAKHGIVSSGTIDCGFTGAIKAVLFNLSDEAMYIKKGQKITQMVLFQIITPDLEIVDELEQTERGDGGFGSTGDFADKVFSLVCPYCKSQFIKNKADVTIDYHYEKVKTECPICGKPFDYPIDGEPEQSCSSENGCCQIDFDAIDRKLGELGKPKKIFFG